MVAFLTPFLLEVYIFALSSKMSLDIKTLQLQCTDTTYLLHNSTAAPFLAYSPLIQSLFNHKTTKTELNDTRQIPIPLSKDSLLRVMAWCHARSNDDILGPTALMELESSPICEGFSQTQQVDKVRALLEVYAAAKYFGVCELEISFETWLRHGDRLRSFLRQSNQEETKFDDNACRDTSYGKWIAPETLLKLLVNDMDSKNVETASEKKKEVNEEETDNIFIGVKREKRKQVEGIVEEWIGVKNRKRSFADIAPRRWSTIFAEMTCAMRDLRIDG